MPVIVPVREDDAIQYSPGQEKYYQLKPHFNKQAVDAGSSSYSEVALEGEEPVILRAQMIHHCHTVIVKDNTYNNYFMLHVSPQSLSKSYAPTLKKTLLVTGLSNFGLFGRDNALFIDLKKPAYIELDSNHYKETELGTHNDSKLDIIIIVNSEHWDEKAVQADILKTLSVRIPGTIINTNIIINDALEHAHYYDVEFNLQTEQLMVLSRNGWYSEFYDHAFTNNQHRFVMQQLPKEQQLELRADLLALLAKGDEVKAVVFKLMSRDVTTDQLILNPPAKMTRLYETKGNEFTSLIAKIEKNIIHKAKVPVFDLGSALLYKAYQHLGVLHTIVGNYNDAATYFAKVADYAANMSRAEFDDDKRTYSAFAGAAFEQIGDIQQSYVYYQMSANDGFYFDGVDAKLRFARVAAQIKGKELEALEYAIKAKHALQPLIDELDGDDSPDKELISLMGNRRMHDCQMQIDELADYLIEHYADNPLLQKEYNERLGLTQSGYSSI